MPWRTTCQRRESLVWATNLDFLRWETMLNHFMSNLRYTKVRQNDQSSPERPELKSLWWKVVFGAILAWKPAQNGQFWPKKGLKTPQNSLFCLYWKCLIMTNGTLSHHQEVEIRAKIEAPLTAIFWHLKNRVFYTGKWKNAVFRREKWPFFS